MSDGLLRDHGVLSLVKRLRGAITRRKDDRPDTRSLTPGLIVGGLGGPEDELLESGQEEVFSRTEVEDGRIEHQAAAGSGEAGADTGNASQADD